MQRIDNPRRAPARRHVGPDGLAGIVVDRRLDRLQVGRGELHLGAAFEKDLARTEQLRFLEPVGGDDQDFGV